MKRITLGILLLVCIGLAGCKLVEQHFHEVTYDVAGNVTVLNGASEEHVYFVGRRCGTDLPVDGIKRVVGKGDFIVVPLKSDEKQPYVVITEDEKVYLAGSDDGKARTTIKRLTMTVHADKRDITYVDFEKWQQITGGGGI